jgi:biotin carboxyl carrier protein
VSAGDVLVILESMKMELVIAAPTDGMVSGITLRPGDRVELGQALVAIASIEDDPQPQVEAEIRIEETGS